MLKLTMSQKIALCYMCTCLEHLHRGKKYELNFKIFTIIKGYQSTKWKGVQKPILSNEVYRFVCSIGTISVRTQLSSWLATIAAIVVY